MTHLYSVLSQLENELGHVYEYSLCVERAASMNGWTHIGWVPRNCPIPTIPAHWQKNLPKNWGRPIISWLWIFWGWLFCYWKAIRGVPPSSIFLLDNLNLPQTFTFSLALLLAGKSPQLWVIQRHSPHEMRRRGKWLSDLVKWISRCLGPNNFTLFTDSELLVPKYTALFSKSIHLLPIPNTAIASAKRHLGIEGVIDCWWPGGSTRKEKGLAQIQRFSSLLKTKGSLPLRLIVAQKTQMQGVIPSPSVLYIENNLNRSAYEAWLNSVHIALLPYDPKNYSDKTSYIFAEAIAAGLMPLAREGSWLAHELRRFSLEELLLDWDRTDLLEHILYLHGDPKVRKKLQLMKEAYAKFHCMDQFAAALGLANDQFLQHPLRA